MKSVSNWFAIIVVACILTGLLFIKFFGNESLFSYQGIHSSTAGFEQYQSGVGLINRLLKSNTVDHQDGFVGLSNGIDLLKQASSKVTDKQLGGLLSGELSKAKTIELIAQTRRCLDVLYSGYQTIPLINNEFALLISGYNATQKLFSQTIASLPTSATKACLESYLNGLMGAMDSLTFSATNIRNLGTNYQSLSDAYQATWGSCDSIESMVGRLGEFNIQIAQTRSIMDQVQKKLNSKDIATYNELCRYGSVQGLTGLQKSSWIISQEAKSIIPSFDTVTDIKKYIQQLSSGSVVMSGVNQAKGLWNKIFK